MCVALNWTQLPGGAEPLLSSLLHTHVLHEDFSPGDSFPEPRFPTGLEGRVFRAFDPSSDHVDKPHSLDSDRL